MDGIKIERKLNISELRGVCIRYGLYTWGSNENYSDMFTKAKSARTDNDFVKVAQDIWKHTNVDEVSQNHEGFEFMTLLWYVLNDCVHTYVNRV